LTTDFEIIVIGGGIAGLTAGLTSARLGRRTLVLTGTMLGGHLLSIERIEAYPGHPDGIAGYELCPAVQGQAADAGAEFAMAEASAARLEGGRWHVTAPSGDYTAAAIIVATGTSLKALDVPGETVLRGRGVSHCASCDAPLMGAKPVIVVGGGDSALQEALTLAEHAAKVTIVHTGDELTGQATFRDRVLQHPRIDLVPNSSVAEILGEDAVTGVRLSSNGVGGPSQLDAAGVFVYIGLEPKAAFLGSAVPLDAAGHIITNEHFRGGRPGLFAAGTVRAGATFRSVAAAGEGASAAISADAYLTNGYWPE